MEGKKCNVAWMSTKNIAVIRPNVIGEYKRIRWDYASLNIKPLLRPLSDLQKLITVDNESFVPMEKIFGDKWNDWDGESNCLICMRDTYNASRGKVMPGFLQGWILERLYEWKFDVFGLIDNGLAVEEKINQQPKFN